ncbi:MAG: bifunctional UDP-N-acetylmuramoyl-tripeptide:D-alanyl-D-alanine ligase/alanine racemase [Chitinophagaceae bacterium]|nr:bifunctional UDP-N-acetylmuramoyl-tripeptide:D-alanyl-D-alanine ligase/alanine racemase [Chitinophagaceae bacterium]
MKYTLDHIARITGSASVVTARPVEHLLLDSRKIYSPAASLFFALKGQRRNGHLFIAEAYKKGIRSFVISEDIDPLLYPDADFVQVNDTLEALQQVASYHRSQFTIPVIGITGSNGKTIVKEWLYQLLHQDYTIVRSPKSYNSQIGVPLSVWLMNEQHTLAIFEAGISRPGEMKKLERIIQPTIGVLTNIGEAHSEGFQSQEQKEAEKRILFRHAEQPAALEITGINKKADGTTILAKSSGDTESFFISIPFTDDASIQNTVTCWQVMRMLGYGHDVISERMKALQPVNMRLELKKGINHCHIINDSYSADLSSLEIALGFLDQQKAGTRKTAILSDFLQSALQEEELYTIILENLKKHKISRVIGIGEKISARFSQLIHAADAITVELFSSTDDFIRCFRSTDFKEETILVKGARVFEFEKIVQLLEQKVHQTVLEINLNAIVHNLKVYQSYLKPETKVMAMVKAFAYGSGGAEIAGILQYHKVDHLGVAYADEGIELRKAGITLPIMIMNPEISAFDSLAEYNLEPDIYSFDLLTAFENFLQNEGLQQFPVHIEIETGMNRLGFAMTEIEELADRLAKSSLVKVQTVFSHLAASEDPAEDAFTLEQFSRYQSAVSKLQEKLSYPFARHIANSGAIFRFPELHLDMVRLGIGLYGIDSAGTHQSALQPAATLKSTIAQLKHLKAGESVSYNRKGVVEQDAVIATVRIGYADGFSRRLGNGNGKMWVKGKSVPVIGTVCMDMAMIDVTDIKDVQEGDEVVIFGKEIPVQTVAKWADTIPYEVMTSVSQRVKRVYFEE